MATLATSSHSHARWGGGWGWRGGWGWGPGPFLAGALLGGALAAGLPRHIYDYGPYYPLRTVWSYGYGCRRVWNGYYWVRACY